MNHRFVCCAACTLKIHIKCAGIKLKEHAALSHEENQWTWHTCTANNILQSLPFYSASDHDLHKDLANNECRDGETECNETWADFDKMAEKHRTNFKIGHLNANSIAGFKFQEIKTWLLSGRLDILVVSETKLDSTFPNSQFNVDGFRFCRMDRNIHGGGLMTFVRSDVCFTHVKEFHSLYSEEWADFRTESIALRVKIAKSWLTIIGVYRPPSIPKSQWKYELSSLFEAATTLTDYVIFLGDFNCDLLHPDKPPKDGRDLIDLLDVYDFKNLIQSATRTAKTSETLLDLILTNNKRRILSSGVVDVHVSDHSLVYTVLRASSPRSRSRKICLKHFDRDRFLSDLHIIPFHVMDVFDDADDKLFVFESLYNDVVNEHAPVKQVYVRGNQVPYMTEEWRKAIRHRNKLWKKFSKQTHERQLC